jgi:hypothetical protein
MAVPRWNARAAFAHPAVRPALYERAALSMDVAPPVRLIFGAVAGYLAMGVAT